VGSVRQISKIYKNFVRVFLGIMNLTVNLFRRTHLCWKPKFSPNKSVEKITNIHQQFLWNRKRIIYFIISYIFWVFLITWDWSYISIFPLFIFWGETKKRELSDSTTTTTTATANSTSVLEIDENYISSNVGRWIILPKTYLPYLGIPKTNCFIFPDYNHNSKSTPNVPVDPGNLYYNDRWQTVLYIITNRTFQSTPI